MAPRSTRQTGSQRRLGGNARSFLSRYIVVSLDSDIRRRIELARTCMKSLDRGIWHSSISLVTKLRLYNVYILPVLLYGSDTWSVTEASRQRLDAFDQWCLRRILRVPYTAHVTNVLVRSQTDQPPVSSLGLGLELEFGIGNLNHI